MLDQILARASVHAHRGLVNNTRMLIEEAYQEAGRCGADIHHRANELLGIAYHTGYASSIELAKRYAYGGITHPALDHLAIALDYAHHAGIDAGHDAHFVRTHAYGTLIREALFEARRYVRRDPALAQEHLRRAEEYASISGINLVDEHGRIVAMIPD